MSCILNMFWRRFSFGNLRRGREARQKMATHGHRRRQTKGVSISVSEPRHAPKLIKSVEAESEKLCRESAEEKKKEFVGFHAQTFKVI